MEIKKIKKDLKELLAKKGIENVLNKIKELVFDTSEIDDSAHMIEGAFNELIRKRKIGIISQQEENLELNKLRKSVLELIKEITVKDIIEGLFTIETDESNYQWCYSKKLETSEALLSFLHCEFKTDSQYIKFGFKFIKEGSPLLSRNEKIICENDHVIIHISKSLKEKQLKVTSITNGNHFLQGVGTNVNVNTEKTIKLTVSISINNELEFYLNHKLVSFFRIDEILRKNVYLIAWGDRKHEYKYSVTKMFYTTSHINLTNQIRQVLKNQSGIKVLSIEKNQQINRKEKIIGKYNILPNGYCLRLLVFHSSKKHYWPMSEVDIDDKENKWIGNVTFGAVNSTRSSFYLVVVLVPNKLDQNYRNYIETSLENERWNSIDKPLNSEIIICQEILVKR